MPPVPSRPIGLTDIAARCVALVLPHSWSPAIDQSRLDLQAILDGILGRHELPFRTLDRGPRRPVPLHDVDPVVALLPVPLATRYSALRRDVTMVWLGAAGRHPPPFTRRSRPASTPAPSAVDAASRSVLVTRVERPTRDAVTLHLQARGGEHVTFLAGQFVTVLVPIGGRVHRRAYSICSAPSTADSFCLTVKRVEGGLVSGFLHEHAAPGLALRVLGPSGSFTWSSELVGDLVLVAAGSGITPIISVLRTALAHRRRVALLFGNREEQDIIFRHELDELAAAHPASVLVRYALTRPPEGWLQPRGRIDDTLLSSFLDVVPWATDDTSRFYVCGPEGMMRSVERALLDRGVDQARIALERFATPHTDRPIAPGSLRAQPMTVSEGGKERTVVVRAGQTLLEAGLEAGLPFRFSCMMGGCAACRVKLRSGTVHMGEPNALTSAEKQEGHVLACIARPREPVKVELE